MDESGQVSFQFDVQGRVARSMHAGHVLELAAESATARQTHLRTSAKLRAMPVHVIDLHSLAPSNAVW